MLGERLRLRPFVPADATAALAWLGDPDVMEFVEPPFDAALVGQFLELHGLVEPPRVLAIEELATAELVGHAIFHPLGSGELAVGCLLRRDRWGRGYAQEAGRLMLEAAFADPATRAVVAESAPANVRSARALERLGFTRTGVVLAGLEGWECERPRV